MSIRLGGIHSGFDTDSIVRELVRAQSARKDKLVRSKSRVETRQDVWRELNTKIQNFQHRVLNNMRFQGSFAQKTTRVSNESIATVRTTNNAVNGVQTLSVDRLAKSGYLTGGKLAEGTTSAMTLSQLTGGDIATDETVNFTVTIGNGPDARTENIELSGDSTVGSVVAALNGINGINASYDARNQRIFVSSATTGAASNFEITASGSANGERALDALGLSGQERAGKVDGVDAQITLNGAEFTSASNIFDINGLAITALAVTVSGQTVSLTTEDDHEAVFDMVRNFLNEYNELMKEMDRLLGTRPARGFNPLTEDEKATMSDKDIEKWEEQIRGSILHRDESLGTISSAMRNVMMQGVQVNGRTMHLFDLGIERLGFNMAGEFEENAYHIMGDPDSAHTSGRDDKLRAMIADDPDTVTSFFVELTRNMHQVMWDNTRGIKDTRTVGFAFNDIALRKEQDDFAQRILREEQRINKLEDKYWRQFTAMETAMARMTKSQAAISGLLGGF